MEPITAVIEEAERLLKDITPGEWRWRQDEPEPGRSQGTGAWSSDKSLVSVEVNEQWVANNYKGPSGLVLMGDGGAGATCGDIHIENPADGEFIAASPRIIRSLLAALVSPSPSENADETAARGDVGAQPDRPSASTGSTASRA